MTKDWKHTALTLGGGLLALGLGFGLLPLLLPFVLAYGVALLVEPGVEALGRRTPLPRWARSGLCVTVLFLGTGLGLWCFGRVLWGELLRLGRQLPGLLRQLHPGLQRLRLWLEGLAARLPETLSGSAIRWIRELFADGAGLIGSIYEFLSGLASRVLTGLPRLLLGCVTTVLASYMSSAALPRMKAWLKKRLPAAWIRRLRRLRDRCRGAFGGWCRAQLKLMGIVFLLLSLGLWILGVEFPLLFGGLIALLDGLPVLGTGTVLLPWALVSFLQEDSRLGFGLLALYGLCSIGRSVLEPHLVGRQLGLPPLLTLLAFYTGARLFGVPGMVLLPLVAVVVYQAAKPQVVKRAE